MDPGTHDDFDTSEHTTGAGTYHTEPSPAYDSALAHVCFASQTTHTHMATGTGIVLPIPSAETSLSNENGHRDHPQDKAARSILYTCLTSIFHRKDRNATILTPPASPKNCNFNSPSPTHDEHHSFMICEALVPANSNSENAPPSWTPMTPNSVDHHNGRKSKLWPPNTACLSQESALNGEEKNMEVQVNDGIFDASSLGLGECLCLSSRIDSAGRRPKIEKEYPHVNHGDGIQLGEDEDLASRSKTKSVRWGKTRAPPIPWDVLIDDLCSPVSLTWDAGSIDLGQFAHQATEYDDDFYDLQYALEISRRDRRKTMSGPDSAGEYSKSRESWAILHINRVMPEDQEYWFRYWLQWHRRLEERAAFKLQKAYRKEEFNRYQSVDPWPLNDRRTARHPRQADEDLHPNLRLMRHRTRSAPGRVHV